ncbi:hypothetical protein P879_12007 [Paragonimus westermani]|uniref:J domain-containing protein n=1 Tax=Paragonimus westermani TaxID=34504 RepID=A0A8T0D4B3_9TREM|nr:hypothetical protein P879_12007 [Paragonimus westermani]
MRYRCVADVGGYRYPVRSRVQSLAHLYSSAEKAFTTDSDEVWLLCMHNHEYFCKCGKIQPVDKNMSYFDAFGYVKPVVQIDTVDLARRMRNIQKQLHPDGFSRASPYEQKLAADAATFINQAYATLHKHIGRFSYILSLHGFKQEDSPPSGSVNRDCDIP